MLSIIAAHDLERCIGKGGRLPWHIPGEQLRFKALTMGHEVIIGRRSFEEIGHPLPGRRCIVLTRQKNYDAPGCLVAHTLKQALSLARGSEVFVAGGAEVYAQALPLADRLYLTEIQASFGGDTFFPHFDESQYYKYIDAEVRAIVPYTYIKKPAAEIGNPHPLFFT